MNIRWNKNMERYFEKLSKHQQHKMYGWEGIPFDISCASLIGYNPSKEELRASNNEVKIPP